MNRSGPVQIFVGTIDNFQSIYTPQTVNNTYPILTKIFSAGQYANQPVTEFPPVVAPVFPSILASTVTLNYPDLLNNPVKDQYAANPNYPTYPVGSVYYLGTGEVPPKIEWRPSFRPVFNIDSGHVPYDKAYEGQDAIITMNLNNWDEWVYQMIGARDNARSNAYVHARGFDSATSIGTMLMSEGMAYSLYLQYPLGGVGGSVFGGGQTNPQNGMPPGYRFLCGYPINAKVIPGTATNYLQLTWHALRLYNYASDSFCLFDHNMLGVTQITGGVHAGIDSYVTTSGVKPPPRLQAILVANP